MVLRLWLGEEPVDSALFLRLSLICTATMLLGKPFYQGIIATGNIRNYQIVVTVVGCSVFPLTWLAYKIGLAVDTFYWIYFVVYNILIWIRMWFCKRILGFRIKNFVKGVFIPVILCTLLSIPVPGIIFFMMDDTIVRLLVLTLSSFIRSSSLYDKCCTAQPPHFPARPGVSIFWLCIRNTGIMEWQRLFLIL